MALCGLYATVSLTDCNTQHDALRCRRYRCSVCSVPQTPRSTRQLVQHATKRVACNNALRVARCMRRVVGCALAGCMLRVAWCEMLRDQALRWKQRPGAASAGGRAGGGGLRMHERRVHSTADARTAAPPRARVCAATQPRTASHATTRRNAECARRLVQSDALQHATRSVAAGTGHACTWSLASGTSSTHGSMPRGATDALRHATCCTLHTADIIWHATKTMQQRTN